MNYYSTLADIVVVIHAAYVLFVIFGLLAVLLGILFAGRGRGTSGSASFTWR
jgi:hypothetical protein